MYRISFLSFREKTDSVDTVESSVLVLHERIARRHTLLARHNATQQHEWCKAGKAERNETKHFQEIRTRGSGYILGRYTADITFIVRQIF